MIDVQKMILSVMKKQVFSGSDQENQAARNVLAELKTKQIDLRVAHEITAVEQNKLLEKMKADRENSARIYRDAGRGDLATSEQTQADVIAGLQKLLESELPKMLSADEIRALIAKVIADNPQPSMGTVMKAFKDNPNVNRKLVSQIAGEML